MDKIVVNSFQKCEFCSDFTVAVTNISNTNFMCESKVLILLSETNNINWTESKRLVSLSLWSVTSNLSVIQHKLLCYVTYFVNNAIK